MNRRALMKRNDILDAASQLFALHGYQGTNMKLLAREAQASTSTIYSYFQDKTDLLKQSIERRLDALESRYLAQIEEIEDPIEALLHGLGLLNSAVAEDSLLSSLVIYQPHVADTRLRAHARRVIQRIDGHSVALIRKGIDQGFIECDDPQALVCVFRLAFQGWLLNREQGEPQLSQQQLTLAVKRLILEMIKDDNF